MSKGNISKTMQAKSNLIADMNLACEYYAIVPFLCNSKKKRFWRRKKAKAIALGIFQFSKKNRNCCFSVY